jgi:hypothetical protein
LSPSVEGQTCPFSKINIAVNLTFTLGGVAEEKIEVT